MSELEFKDKFGGKAFRYKANAEKAPDDICYCEFDRVYNVFTTSAYTSISTCVMPVSDFIKIGNGTLDQFEEVEIEDFKKLYSTFQGQFGTRGLFPNS